MLRRVAAATASQKGLGADVLGAVWVFCQPTPKVCSTRVCCSHRILGVGTFGRVKLVRHKPTNTAYALKCMRKQQVVATKQHSHVLNEKQILASMDHPFILRLIATYQDEGELMMLL